jgi:hypothetical protein
LGYNVDSCSGNTISGYFSSGVEGPLLGLQNNYLTGSNLISGTGFVFVSGTESIDYQATKKLSANSILFNKSVSSSDVYEVYSYNTHFKDLNLRPDYLSNENGYFLDIDSKDINYTGGNVNAYRSGYFYYSGTGFSITEDTLKFTNLPTSNQSSESVVYNYILGDQVAFPSDLSFTGYNGVISGTGANYLNKDVYFSHNGSYDMTKLVSGLDWSGQSNRFEIDATNRGSGIYVFAPMAAQTFNRATGNADYLINLDFRLTNEEIWLNGVKQLRGVDYLLVDSGQKGINAGLVNTFTRVSFNDNLNNWNI